MKNWKWWAFLLVGTSLCLCAPTAFAAESAGLHTQLPGAELWQPYLDQSPVDALQVAEDPWSVLQSFCTSSLFQTLRESIPRLCRTAVVSAPVCHSQSASGGGR